MNKVIEGKKPTEEDLFYKIWGWETLKDNIKMQNDMFKIFITLETVIITTYLGLFSAIHIPTIMKNIIFTLLSFSLICSIIGIFPFAKEVNLNMPTEIKSYKLEKMKRKGIFLKLSLLLLFGSFLIFFFATLCF